jgi:hypothetical protein
VSYNGKTGLKSLEEQQHFEKSFPILVLSEPSWRYGKALERAMSRDLEPNEDFG